MVQYLRASSRPCQPLGSPLHTLRIIASQQRLPLCTDDWMGSIMYPKGATRWRWWYFYVSPRRSLLNDGGVYIFVKRIIDLRGAWRWYPLYVGKTNDLDDRLLNHEKLKEASKLGLSHLHSLQTPVSYTHLTLPTILLV